MITLAEKGRSQFVVTLGGNATTAEHTAAKELADHVEKSTGVRLPVQAPSPLDGRPCVAVGPAAAVAAGLSRRDLRGLGDEGGEEGRAHSVQGIRSYVLRPRSSQGPFQAMKQSVALLMTAVSLCVTACHAIAGPQNNPFGVLVGDVNVPTRIRIAKELHARYYRTTQAVFTEAWNGQHEECAAALAAGLELVLTVRNGAGARQPSSPPKDMDAYKRTLGKILDRHRPAILIVENEENSQALFYQGTAEEYLAELQAAAAVAHARDIRCANGGLVSTLVAVLVADSYRVNGDKSRADAYLKGALDERHLRMFQQHDKRVRDQIDKGKKLLAGYRQAGADFVNFHWYIADTNALHEAVAFLKASTGLPVICNEMGQQKNENPEQVTAMMQAVLNLRLPILIWYSDDVTGYGEARALQNSDGTLRPNGAAFKAFIETSLSDHRQKNE